MANEKESFETLEDASGSAYALTRTTAGLAASAVSSGLTAYAFESATGGMMLGNINADGNIRTAAWLDDGNGNKIASALDVAGSRNLLTAITHNIFVSTKNSTTANLAAGAFFLGTSDNNLNATTIQINVKADQPLTIQVQQSNDNTNWDFVDSYYLSANQDDSRLFLAAGSYVRVKITNSGTATTTYLNCQTILVPIQSVLPRTLTTEGSLKTSITEVSPDLDNILTADRAVFGSAITLVKIKKLTGNFSLAINNNDVSTSVTSTGTVTSSNGMAVLATGTNTTASASLFTNQKNNYAVGRESYFVCSVVFTTPPSANSEQRAGIYDASNGFFIGYHGTSFGVTVRSNGVDTFTAQSAFNEDLLNGNPNSGFTFEKSAVALDPTKMNKYRIRFGYGSGLVLFEILSPDDTWIRFHEITGINSLTAPDILNPSLPVTFEATKTADGASNITVSVPSFEAGVVDNPNAYGIEEVNGRSYKTAEVSAQTTSQAVYTNSPGRTLRVTLLDISVANGSLVATGQLNIRDGSTGTILYTLTIPASTNQSTAGSNKTLTFSVPLRFSTGVYAQVVSGTLTYSVMFVGFEAES